MSYGDTIEDAIIRGDWASVHREAQAWTGELERNETSGVAPDPRASFALNVAQLLRGEVQEAWKSHAKSLQEAADIARVRGWTEALLARHPEKSGVQLVMGLFLAQSGQSEQSVDRYKEAVRLDPLAAPPHYFLAQIHERAGRQEVAIKEYREAVKLDPSYTLARTNLGVLYQEQGRLEMAIPQYREVIKLTPFDAVAHANLACALAEQGKLEAAVLEYQEALR